MSAEAIVAISAAVTALVQLSKWAGLKDSWGPIVVILFSGVGVLIWLLSQTVWPPARTDTWDIFAGWVSVALASAGIFGFTRASVSAVTAAKAPPADGAGSSPTVEAADLTADDIKRVDDHAERLKRWDEARAAAARQEGGR